MIWLLRPDHGSSGAERSSPPAMAHDTESVPRLPAVAGKTVEVAFDGGRMTSDRIVNLTCGERERPRPDE